MIPFKVIYPAAEQIPILVSVPHCGTFFPEEVQRELKEEHLQFPDDADGDVHRLYSFASELGITIVHANFHRWVVDLNRDPAGQPLYRDGRIITGLCPVTTFNGESIYQDERTELPRQEMEFRVHTYFNPYHHQLQRELEVLKAKFNHVVLWDCHSIRRLVPGIQPGPFPDLILGTADGKACHPRLSEIAARELMASKYGLQLNDPFKGGYITRHYGRPSAGVHAIQLEMAKDLYMQADETKYDPDKARDVQEVLMRVFQHLSEELKQLNQ